MRTDFDAVVVGAGPAGSATATLLARAGWSVALIEKQRFPRRKVCGECIAASNLPLLSALGVIDRVDALAGPPIQRIGFLHGVHSATADMPAAPDRVFPWGRALGRETLDTLLADAARQAGVALFQPWSVQAIDGAPGNWCIAVREVESGRQIQLQCAVAVDAHGSWGALRGARQIQGQGQENVQGQGQRQPVHRPSDLLAFKANFIDADLPPGLLPILAFDGGYGGMVRADGGVTTLACCVRRDQVERLRHAHPGLDAGAAVEAFLKAACSGVGAALQGARRDVRWLAAGPLTPGIRLGADDLLFRVGNAAAEAHPIIGEGISMALQAAFLLAECLTAGSRNRQRADPAWQAQARRQYCRQWRRQFSARLRLAAAFAHVAMRPAGAALLLHTAQRLPGMLSWGAQRASKTRCAVDAAIVARLATGERR